MDVKFENKNAYCVPNVKLIAENIKEMVEVLKKELDSNNDYDTLVLDLSESQNIDSMGIIFLIGIYKTIAARGKTIKLMGLSEEMKDLFKIMKLDEIFEFEKSA